MDVHAQVRKMKKLAGEKLDISLQYMKDINNRQKIAVGCVIAILVVTNLILFVRVTDQQKQVPVSEFWCFVSDINIVLQLLNSRL